MINVHVEVYVILLTSYNGNYVVTKYSQAYDNVLTTLLQLCKNLVDVVSSYIICEFMHNVSVSIYLQIRIHSMVYGIMPQFKEQ